MKKISILIAVATLLVASCSKINNDPKINVSLDAANGQIIEGKYIVVFKKNILKFSDNISYAQRVSDATGFYTDYFRTKNYNINKFDQVFVKALNGVVVNLTPVQLAELNKDENVLFVENDRIVTLGKPGGKPGGGSSSQVVPWGVQNVGNADATGKTAWIIDTGVDLDHSDLNVDVSRSASFIPNGPEAGNPDDMNGHGSHVAGTIAAKNNSTGVLGVAYNATVVAVKVLDRRGSGSYSSVIAGVDYVAANASAGDVANMSLGGPVSDALDLAVVNAASQGVLFALAAGNESDNANNSSPARVNHPNVFTVSAMNSSLVFASFSNYGNPPVDFCAPGVSIQSTWKDGGYNTISGTSMASPHVAGLLLLNGTAINTSGYVSGDPDGNADPIAHK